MKVKHGICIEISDRLSANAASVLAQWIGSYTVIKNQKSIQAKEAYQAWLDSNKDASLSPIVDQRVAYLSDELPFLKEIPSQIRRNAGAKWFEAMNAAKAGLRKQPTIRAKHQKRNVYITNELFDIQDVDETSCVIHIKKSSKKCDKGAYLLGVKLPFPAKDAGKSVYISRKGTRFYLSMSYNHEVDALSEDDLKSLIQQTPSDQLDSLVTGHDLGVAKQVVSSDGEAYHFTQNEVDKLKNLQSKKLRYQRAYARKALVNDQASGTKKRKRTNREKKLLSKIAKYSEQTANIKRNRSHHISKQIAEAAPLVAGFENLKINNMVRKAKPKQDAEGKYIANGAKAKSGLNKAILASNMGQIRTFAAYKLKERGKLFVKVKAAYSSQECARCGHVHKDNRKTQADFICLSCQHADNADHNAACVIKKRTINYLQSDAFLNRKTARKISRRHTNKAKESSSLDCGGLIRRSLMSAKTNDALNFLKPASS